MKYNVNNMYIIYNSLCFITIHTYVASEAVTNLQYQRNYLIDPLVEIVIEWMVSF